MVDELDIFRGTSGPRDADIAIVGESWGIDERRQGRPFVGRSGMELTKILAECGIARNKCFFTNVVSEQPPGNKMHLFFHPTQSARKEYQPLIRGLYPKANVLHGIELLQRQLAVVKPKLIIGFGNYSLWALTENSFQIKDETGYKVPTGITSWRGSQLYCRTDMGGFKLLPTYHPAAALRQWPWRYDIVHDLKARVPKALNEKWDPPQYNFIIRPSFETVMETFDFFTEHAKDKPFILSEDIETAHKEYITCMGFAWSNVDAICVPFCRLGGLEHYWSEEEEIEIVLAIRRLHANPNIHVVGMNFLYDAQYIALLLGYVTKCHADVMFLHHLCWPGKPKSLNYISSLYNYYHCFWKDEGKEWHPTFSDEQHWNYNCKDCVITYESNTALQQVVVALKLEEQAALQMEQFDIALEMMLRGVRVDLQARANLSADLAMLITNRCEWLETILPVDVYPRKPKASSWYTSPKQQASIFYDVLGIEEVQAKGKRSAKGRTCNDDALTTIGSREPCLRPIIQSIKELRSLQKFRTNFVEAELDADGKLRCFFDPTGTKAFRWNSSKNAFGRGCNLQTIPKGSED